MTGIKLYGDAGDWWKGAEGNYQRGNKPVAGAVLVLKKTSHMRSGHVAVVKNILGPREINVTHSNWGDSRKSRHIIYDSMLVKDVSDANDWTLVRFWNDSKMSPASPTQHMDSFTPEFRLSWRLTGLYWLGRC